MRKFHTLIFAVILNALGQALMAQTEFGMTAWGVAAINLSNFSRISLGTSFILLSVLAYFLACLIRSKYDMKEMIQSFTFLFAFGILTDIFVYLIPNLGLEHILLRFALNFVGLFILLFSIALHLKVNIAIHPMDVYLKVMQKRLNSVRYGTYFSYSSAFVVGIVFGLLYGEIEGIHFGTVYALLLSGLLFDFYNRYMLHNIHFDE